MLELPGGMLQTFRTYEHNPAWRPHEKEVGIAIHFQVLCMISFRACVWYTGEDSDLACPSVISYTVHEACIKTSIRCNSLISSLGSCAKSSSNLTQNERSPEVQQVLRFF